MPKERFKFYTERGSFWVQGAVIFMALSAVFRVIGCWGLWNDQYFALTQMALPIGANLLFILLLVLLGKHAIWATSLPVLMGVVFFVLKALSFNDTLQMALCILLYVAIAIVYIGTTFTWIKTKWLLVPLFAIPFLYHVCVIDVARLRDTVEPVTFAAGMQEMSVLCIMLALLFTALGLKRKDTTKYVDLPKMKGGRVIRPAQPQEPSGAEAAAEAEPAPAANPAPAAETKEEKPAEETQTEEGTHEE